VTTVLAILEQKIMASDSLITTYSVLTAYRSDKLYRAGGSIFGEAGDVAAGLRFRRWAQDGMPKKDRPKFSGYSDDDFSVLELSKEGLWMWDATMVRQKVMDPVYAIGSGARIAMYCVSILKMDAEAAILEAAKVDIHTAGPVQILRLNDKE
jgi:hypothetical protein